MLWPIQRALSLLSFAIGLPAGLLVGLLAGFLAPMRPAVAKPLYEPEPVIAIRVDPGRLYDALASLTHAPEKLAEQIVKDTVSFGFNTIVVYAYSSVYGAYYRTHQPFTTIEPTLGRGDFVGKLIAAAKKRGLRVYAAMPALSFKSVWTARPTWRMKRADDSDFHPLEEAFFLSPSDGRFTSWYVSFMRDFLKRYPQIDGIEIVEPDLDPRWEGVMDRTRDREFRAYFPREQQGSETWSLFRSWPLWELMGRAAAVAHERARALVVVQTWPAGSGGTLIPSPLWRKRTGFDFETSLLLPSWWRPDVWNVELIWQQWQAEHGGETFSPEWSARTFSELRNTFAGRVNLWLHVELSLFSSRDGMKHASIEEIRDLVSKVQDQGASGIDVYDYSLWRQQAIAPPVR